MKTTKIILLALNILLLIACSSEQKQSEIPVVDVTKTYPKKEIVLQDIAEVEYIPLETRDDVLIDNNRRIVYCSNDTIIIHNKQRGDFLFFWIRMEREKNVCRSMIQREFIKGLYQQN